MKDAAAIIVAGGKGLRFGGPVRKQYLRLAGHPLIWWSLRAFQRCPAIAEVILVVPPADLQKVTNSYKNKAVYIVAGGPTRAESVQNGLKALSPWIKWVAVHDAVRPLVAPSLIEETLRQARRHRAAIAATPSKDTVKLANGDGCIDSTPPRDHVWLAQTPQTFERKLLEVAHGLTPSPAGKREKVGMRARRPLTPALSHLAAGEGAKVTDDAQLVERLGIRVKLVLAPPENLKITTPLDLMVAKSLMRRR